MRHPANVVREHFVVERLGRRLQGVLKGALRLGVHPIREQGGDVLELVREIRRDRFAGGARHNVSGLEAESLGEDGGERAEGAEEQSVPLRARELPNGSEDRLGFGEALRESVARHPPNADRSRTRRRGERGRLVGGVSVGDGVTTAARPTFVVHPGMPKGVARWRDEGRPTRVPSKPCAPPLPRWQRARAAAPPAARRGGRRRPGRVRSSCVHVIAWRLRRRHHRRRRAAVVGASTAGHEPKAAADGEAGDRDEPCPPSRRRGERRAEGGGERRRSSLAERAATSSAYFG